MSISVAAMFIQIAYLFCDDRPGDVGFRCLEAGFPFFLASRRVKAQVLQCIHFVGISIGYIGEKSAPPLSVAFPIGQ